MNSRFFTRSLITATIVSAYANVAYAEEATVENVNIDISENIVTATIALDTARSGSAVSAFVLDSPNRIAVDISESRLSENFEQTVVDNDLVSRVEVETFELLTRVTFHISEGVTYNLSPEDEKITISMMMDTETIDPLADALSASSSDDVTIVNNAPFETPLSGPDTLVNGPTLSSLDFDQQESVSRIVIGLQGTDSYSDSRPRPDTILIDIPNAFVPRSLSRVLDTSRFYTPVKMVRAYRTSSGARIAINLRGNPEYSVSRSSDGFLYVDIPIPESMIQDRSSARQSATTVAPEGPQTGLSNAYQSEILIGEQGRTSDPQSVFGTGSGSGNPAAQLGMASGFMIDNTSSRNSQFTGRPISIDLVNADIHHIFRLFNSVSNLNIVAGDDVAGTVSVTLKDVPWDQALAAILQAKGLGSQRFGNIIRVAPIETIKSEQQAALETKRAQEELTELQLLVIPLNYAQASELEQQVSELLSSRGSLQVDTRGNQLIIKETEQRLAQIRELIRHLDKPTPQVMIESRVVEASSGFSKMLGIQWGSELDASTTTGYSTGLFFPNDVRASGGMTQGGGETFYSDNGDTLLVDLGADASTSSMAFSLGSIPGLIDLDARLSAMESDGYGKVVSEPRITTLDNQEALIQQGARVPYLSTSSGGTTVQFVEATLQMSVTPHITSDDTVFMSLNISNNRPDFSQLVQGQPAIQIKEAQTSVLVGDGDTTVIGGVFSSETAFSQDRTPGLYKIPLLGYLFKNQSESISRNEMLVFVTPHIVTRTSQAATSAQ